jgi:uncharacterized protein
LREVESYYAILLAVAAGHTTSQDIARQAGIEARSLSYYLQQLLELGYLRRRHPLTSERPSARHVRYDLDDPLLRFWFRFSRIRVTSATWEPERALKDLIPHLDAYFGGCFESLCREALPWLYRREGLTAAFNMGEYWSRDVQIDVGGVRDDGWTDLGECKWGTVRSPASVEQELEEKVRAYPNRRGATIGRRIFVRQAPPGAREAGGARWHGLEELYT